MPRLTVEGFSTIRRAELEIAPLTLLVGPQASGKSLLSKLFYFFNDLIRAQNSYAQDGETIRTLRDRMGSRFKEWFPPGTWGQSEFTIKYTAGPVEFNIVRKNSGQREPSRDVKVLLSRFFAQQYTSLLQRYRSLDRDRGKQEDDEFISRYSGPRYDIERDFYRALREKLNSEYIDSQIFVPAGRSFFTNLGKAFAILEHGGKMDTTLSRFGSLYAFLVDEGASYYVPSDRVSRNLAKARQEKRRTAMHKLFGGQIRIGGNKQYLETDDGRQIPFALMSSGQQELLPLWLTVSHITRGREFFPRTGGGYSLLFIEEPEAHLFPSAQSYLVEYLASLINESDFQTRMVLSTHSPYVLAKINNLMKASAVAEKSSETRRQVSQILPSNAWLPNGAVKAYSIRNGKTEFLVEKDGLLSGSYLDEISNEISSEFLRILEVEVSSDS